MTTWTSLRYAVLDVEGNGQQPPDLVELAIVPIENGQIGEVRSWLVKPERPITGIARRIHGISSEQVAGAPTFSAIEDQVRQALAADVLVAHNAHVDVGVLARYLSDWQRPDILDTLKLTKRLRPQQVSYKLGALVEAFRLAEGLPDGLTPHRATYDALVTARLLLRLAIRDDDTPLSIEELLIGSPPPQGNHDQTEALF